MTQSIFHFDAEHDYAPENFLVSSSNQLAYAAVTNFPWQNYALNIHGPTGSGKTHLAHLAPEEVFVLEDIDQNFNQTELFHLLNKTKEEGKFILLTSIEPLNKVFTLPDLVSRLSAINHVAIETPDNQLFYMLFARHFAARQLKVSDEVINYLVTRLDRSFEKALSIIDKIDKLSLQEKRNITIPLVKNVL